VTRGSRNWPTGLKISAPVETNPDIDVNNLFTGETINLSADAEKAFPKGTVFTWTLTRDDKPISLPRPKGQKLTYTFTEPGKYFFSVSAVNAKGAVCGELKTYVPYVLDVKKPSTYRGTPAVTISDNLKNSYTLGQKVDGAITCSSDIPATFTLTILREGKKLKTYKDFSALNGFRFSQLGDYVFKCEATDINDDNIKGYAQRSVGVFKADICENNETLDYPNAVRDKDSVVRGSAETVVFTASGVHDDCYKAVTVDTTQLDQILLPDYTVKYDPAKMTLTVTGTLRDANNIPNQVELPYYDGNGALSGYVRVYTPAQTEPRVITPKVAPHNGESFTLSLSPDVPGATAKMEITDVAGIQVAGISGFSGNLTLPSGTYIIKSTITPANDVPYTLADVYLDIYDSPPEIQTFSYDPSSCTRDPNYATTTSPVCPQNVKFSLIAQAQYSLSLSTITVNFGDGTSTTFAANPLTKAYEFTHEYRGDKGQATYNIVISVTDSAGQTTTMGKDGRWSFRVN
jgi:hypothetical protein